MLTSNPPWHEFEAMAAIFKIATVEQPKYELPAGVSEVCKDFMRQCFCRNPQDRPVVDDLLRHKFSQVS